jgi:hypothetical protein
MKTDNFRALQKRLKSDSFVTDSALHAQLCAYVHIQYTKPFKLFYMSYFRFGRPAGEKRVYFDLAKNRPVQQI